MKKNGSRGGVQRYKCLDCNRQCSSGRTVESKELWKKYIDGLNLKQLGEMYHVNPHTIQRWLRAHNPRFIEDDIQGLSGFIHMDVSYLGRSQGVLLCLDHKRKLPLYIKFIASSERVSDYLEAISNIEARGYIIKGIVVDGLSGLIKALGNYEVQFCQYHQLAIVRRYITKYPRLAASKELSALMSTLCSSSEEDFKYRFSKWKERWDGFLKERKLDDDGKPAGFIHRRLRSAVFSIQRNMPHLFVYQRENNKGMSNTNNPIEGCFTSLKTALRNHPGMPKGYRERFVIEFFEAKKAACRNKAREKSPSPELTTV